MDFIPEKMVEETWQEVAAFAPSRGQIMLFKTVIDLLDQAG